MAKNTADTTNPDPWAAANSEPKVKKDKKKKDKTPKPDTSGIESPAGTEPPAKKNNYDDLLGPGSGGNFTPKDHEGALLMIAPLSLEEGINTSNGVKDAIKADIVVLDREKPARSEEIKGGLVFPQYLQSQLQQGLARKSRVVGTLYVDHAGKKPGQNAPWKLSAPTNEDIDVARRYLDSLG